MISQSWRFAAFPLIAGALAACSGIDGLPDLPRPDAVDAGVTVPLADSSDAADSTLPDASVADGGADGGADAATPDDAGPDSTVVDAAIDATIADAAPCVAEDNGAFCTRLAKNCGAVAANDNCGTARSVASCGTCSSYYESCGGGGQAGVCGCLPESDWAFCTRTGNSCGSASGTDNCGNARAAPSCGGVCQADAGAGDATVSDGGDGGSSCYGATCAANAICRPQSDAGSGGCNCNFAVTGLLGDGTFCEMPKEVEPIRYESYCVLTTGGRVGCWGDNSNGQLGTGDTLSRDSIAWIPSAQLPEIASLSGNPSMVRMCGLSRAGHAYCWGDGAQFFSSTPVFVRSLTPVRFIDGTYTRIRQRIEGDWLHAVCLESSATSDAAAGTKCYGQASASSYQGHLYTNTITNMIGFTSAQGAGYISGSSVLWALGVIVGEAGGTGSPIVKAVDYLRLTSSGTLYGMRFNPVQGVSNLWAGNLIQQGTTVLNGFPGEAYTRTLLTLSAGQTVRAAGASAGGQCVITSQPQFACFGNSASPRL